MKAFALLVSVVSVAIIVGCAPKDAPALTPDSLDPGLQIPDAGEPLVPPSSAPTPSVQPAQVLPPPK